MKAILIILVIATMALQAQPPWDNRLNFQDITQRLQTEPIKKNLPFGDFLKKKGERAKANNKMLLIELESGLQGVFKPGEYAYAEVAAYKASCALGLRLVPPTVMRIIDGVSGSLQFYISGPYQAPTEYVQEVRPKMMSDMKVFYYVFGQWDVHSGNQILSLSRGSLFLGLIDNAGMLHRLHGIYGERPFIEKGNERKGLPCVASATFPFEHVSSLKGVSENRLYELFGAIIPKQIPRLAESGRYVFWQDTLWMEVSRTVGKIEAFYASTICALKALNTDMLREIWSEWYAVEPRHAEQLIALTLERRDQLLQAAPQSGIIIKD